MKVRTELGKGQNAILFLLAEEIPSGKEAVNWNAFYQLAVEQHVILPIWNSIEKLKLDGELPQEVSSKMRYATVFHKIMYLLCPRIFMMR